MRESQFFGHLTRVHSILEQDGGEIGIEAEQLSTFYERFKHKRYAILISLRNARYISPFEIDKAGYGAMSAWISVENVDQICVPQR